VILDAHTHAFPPAMLVRRGDLVEQDPTFRLLYAAQRAKLVTADETLRSMDGAGVDVSVIAGFAWRDPQLCREHNDYLLRCAAESRGRLLAFCTVSLQDVEAARLEITRCARGGARGLGEMRPESQGASLSDPAVSELLAWAAEAYDLPLLVHASEPVGHPYAGKDGQSLGPLYDFVERNEHVRVIAAHWGGGLPFYALMPEVRVALENVWVDTAATPLLYAPEIYRAVAGIWGSEHILFGSDFPLLRQSSQLAAVRSAPIPAGEAGAILGRNALRALGLERLAADE
jgi:predicted TIM-barrel fold metal-dependent hydrolase